MHAFGDDDDNEQDGRSDSPPESDFLGAPPQLSSVVSKLVPQLVDVRTASDAALIQSIATAATGDGLLRLRGVGSAAAVSATKTIFDELDEQQPTEPGNGVSFKGAWLEEGEEVARSQELKLILDLESAQLGTGSLATTLFPGLCATPTTRPLRLVAALNEVVSYLDAANGRFMRLVHEALASVVGHNSTGDEVRHEASNTMLKYRLCDYPAHPACRITNRCSAHTDYGTATLIFEDGVPGLQIWRPDEEQWHDVVSGSLGDALLLFGWCSTVRSNGHVNAQMHRVVTTPQTAGTDGLVPRRTSLVLFAAPPPEAKLDPAKAFPHEPAKYRSGVAGTWRQQAQRAHRQL